MKRLLFKYEEVILVISVCAFITGIIILAYSA